MTMCRFGDLPDDPILSAQIATIRAYRETHVIAPVTQPLDPKIAPETTVTVCEHDGIRVHPIRGGYRHDNGEVTTLAKATAAYA